jgi:hypothetical protein
VCQLSYYGILCVCAGKLFYDPCRKDPCENIVRAVVGTCKLLPPSDYECECQPRFKWDDVTDSCISSAYEVVASVIVLCTLYSDIYDT